MIFISFLFLTVIFQNCGILKGENKNKTQKQVVKITLDITFMSTNQICLDPSVALLVQTKAYSDFNLHIQYQIF